MRRALQLLLVGTAIAATGNLAMAQSKLPEGWFLQEDDYGGVKQLTLAYYAPGTSEVEIALNCHQDFAEVLFSFFTDFAGQSDEQAASLVLSNEGVEFPIAAIGNGFQGRYVIEGTVALAPPLTDLLRSRFTVSVDGSEMAQYTAKTGGTDIEKVIEACRDRQ